MERDVVRDDCLGSGRVQIRRVLRELHQFDEVAEGPRSTPASPIVDIGRTADRSEGGVSLADADRPFRVTSPERERRWAQRQVVGNEFAVEADDRVLIDAGTGGGEDAQRLVVIKRDARLLEDPHRGVVDRDDLLGRRDVIGRECHERLDDVVLVPSGRSTRPATGAVSARHPFCLLASAVGEITPPRRGPPRSVANRRSTIQHRSRDPAGFTGPSVPATESLLVTLEPLGHVAANRHKNGVSHCTHATIPTVGEAAQVPSWRQPERNGVEVGSRRLAAVMFTDMVGFTALMQTDEAEARVRRARYVDAMTRFHEIHGGSVEKWLGDGALSIFPSAASSVRCAADIQREIREDDPVEMRVGIHIGDVTMVETGLLGDAVNLASRIESFAVPGAVMMSDAIHDQVKNQADLSFVDLGAYRLKNVGRPYRILALDAPGLVVPPPGHLEGKGDRAVLLPVTLPERSGRVFGRDDQLNRLSALLDDRRLVTLIGPGGIGKTTLAVTAGKTAGGRFDAVAFVPLAAVDAPELVVPAIADTLEVKQSEERSPLDGVLSFLGDHRVLLILDNFEQVTDAAPEIAEIVRSCPSTHVLVTSRGPLHLTDETVFPVAPLELPQAEDLDALAGSPAVALLVDAARRVSPDFEVTRRERCLRSEYLPSTGWAPLGAGTRCSTAQVAQSLETSPIVWETRSVSSLRGRATPRNGIEHSGPPSSGAIPCSGMTRRGCSGVSVSSLPRRRSM